MVVSVAVRQARSTRLVRLWRTALVAGLSLATTSASAGPRDRDDEEEEHAPKRKAVSYDFDADFEMDMPEMAAPAPAAADMIDAGETLGATPGGAQDTNLLRALVEAGTVPRPEHVSPEGLFSQYDLPLKAATTCEQLMCVHAEVTDASLVTTPGLHYLAQLGFSSGLTPSEMVRPALNLVFVVDTSSSLAGRPFEVMRESIIAVAGQLGPEDQVTIVGFDEQAQVLLAPTRSIENVSTTVYGMYPQGASHLDAGLFAGVRLAQKTARSFDGSTRIMLFTDDRPTYGRDRPSAFVELAREASASGIGMTTVGVGTHFDSALAKQVASVRGGNLLFFNDVERMRTAFESDFDTMVTELAHDMKLVVSPSPGLKITEVYGVPNSAVKRRGDGIELSVETLFLSRKKGAIYFGIDPVGRPNLPRSPARAGMDLGEVRLTYSETDGTARFSESRLVTIRSRDASPGLQRGSQLVDEALALERAAVLFHEQGDREGARKVVAAVAPRIGGDPELSEQTEVIEGLLGLLGP